MADRINDINDDNVQHGIDDDPHNDGVKGLELGALGGGAVGAMAGLAAGPVGMIVGAIVGGTAGSIASGAAVDAVDAIDNDNTVTGIGGGATRDVKESGVTADRLHDHDTDMHASGVTADRLHDHDTDIHASGVTAEHLHGTDVAAAGAAGVGAMGTTRTEGDGTVVQLAAEELHVDKIRQQAGEVEIHKEVVQEHVEIPVTLEHEEVVITRRAVDGVAHSDSFGDADEVVRIPVTEEVANVTKMARVVEEVEVGTRTVTENQTVSGTVRHEELDLNDSTKNRM